MTARPLLVIGAGGHAVSCIDVIEADGRFTVLGLVASATEVGRKILGYDVMATDAELPNLLARAADALIGVGQIRSAEVRVRLFERLQQLGFRLPTIVSPRAYVSRHATLGEGTIVMHGAVINARANVGRNCIINSNALVEHDATVEDHCHVSTAAAINGDVRVGTGSFIGSHAVLREGVNIGAHCVIGMGQSVLANCESGEWRPKRAGA